ncbi:hypothetical protein HK415_07385 [Ramlibacter sp. B156]|uniref:Uncharacterized protein n=1 Tax=Ramlibacter montanisoli TaxID=2732512 RepID=A0A849K9B2_9BURK|nr:hypothetical protein [Ramlibacter montanisoli]
MFEGGKAEELGVQAGDQRAHPASQHQAEQVAARHHRRDQLQVVQGDGAVAVAQGLERRHLFALRGHQARGHHVQQEAGHGQEDRGQHGAQHALLADLVAQHGVRTLLVARMGRHAAQGLQAAVQRIEHGGLGRIRRQLQRHAGEGAAHVHRRGQFVLVGPEDAEGAQVRHAHDAAEDVLGRQRGTRDAQRAPLAVHQRRDRGAGTQLVRLGEAHVDHRFQLAARARPGFRPAAAAQLHLVQALGPARVPADQLADDGVDRAGHAHARDRLDRRLHVDHARDLGQPRGHRIGRPPDHGEHVGELAGRVERVARALQRGDRRQRGDEAADAAGHDQRDGERLAPEQAQVAQHLAIEGLHGLTRRAPPG